MSPERDYHPDVDGDAALMAAYDLGMGESGWTDAVEEEADRLLPTLLASGYAGVDDSYGDDTSTYYTWWFTPEGVARIRELRPDEDVHNNE
jgi:hypothetical protein